MVVHPNCFLSSTCGKGQKTYLSKGVVSLQSPVNSSIVSDSQSSSKISDNLVELISTSSPVDFSGFLASITPPVRVNSVTSSRAPGLDKTWGFLYKWPGSGNLGCWRKTLFSERKRPTRSIWVRFPYRLMKILRFSVLARRFFRRPVHVLLANDSRANACIRTGTRDDFSNSVSVIDSKSSRSPSTNSLWPISMVTWILLLLGIGSTFRLRERIGDVVFSA